MASGGSFSLSPAGPVAGKSRGGSLMELPRHVYDPVLADRAASFPALLRQKEFWLLAKVLLSYLAELLLSLFEAASVADRSAFMRREASRFRELLIKLGPTFIKLGQFLSVRRDLLPLEFADELALLQDQVPAESFATISQVIQAELGALPQAIFQSIDETPIASASIGQVHRVVLPDGRLAVVKVQRPDLAQEFYRDLGFMRLVARSGLKINAFLRRFSEDPAVPPPTRFDFKNWLDMSSEFGRTLFAEIDYLVEGRNADRMRRLLRDKPEVKIPRVIWKYSAYRVLTLEYIEAIKIDRVEELRERGIDLELVATRLINCYLEQIVLKGFFHADPHAGNLAITESGSIVIFDFGMIGELTENQRMSLLSCVVAVIKRDADQLVKSLSDLGVVRPNVNLAAVGRAITPFMDYYAGKSLFDLDFCQLERDIDTVVAERSLHLPANLAYLLRAGSSLEGIARTLKADFSFIEAVKPVMRYWLQAEGIDTIGSLVQLFQLASAAVGGLGRLNNLPKKREMSARNASSRLRPLGESCSECARTVRIQRRLVKRLKIVTFLLVVFILFSATISIWLASLSSYSEIWYIVMIGNLLLGGIIFWNLRNLAYGSRKKK